MGRTGYGYLVFDFPSDHEVEGSLATESDAIRSILANRGYRSQLQSFRTATLDTFEKGLHRRYRGVRFVHLAGHGSRTQLGLIGGSIGWRKVADTLGKYLAPLDAGTQRVLSLSCCYSKDAFLAMKPRLGQHFTSCYFFKKQTIDFSTALTVWSMFYLRKDLRRPERAIVEDINNFFGKDVLSFGRI